MSFSAEIYHFGLPDTPLREKIGYGIWGMMLVVLLCLHLEILPYSGFFSTLVILGLLVQSFMRFTSIFEVEEHTKKRLGLLEVDSLKFNWNGNKIAWSEIKHIAIGYHDVLDKYKYKSGKFEKLRSSGLDNRVEILLKNGVKYEGHLFIESEEKKQAIKEVLWEVVKTNKLSLENARSLLHPANYKEHQELKKYCE